jgi:hypothetical protein
MVEEPMHVKQKFSNVCKIWLNRHYLFKKQWENSMVEEPPHVKQPSSNDVCKIGLNRHELFKKQGKTEWLKNHPHVNVLSLNHVCNRKQSYFEWKFSIKSMGKSVSLPCQWYKAGGYKEMSSIFADQ